MTTKNTIINIKMEKGFLGRLKKDSRFFRVIQKDLALRFYNQYCLSLAARKGKPLSAKHISMISDTVAEDFLASLGDSETLENYSKQTNQ